MRRGIGCANAKMVYLNIDGEYFSVLVYNVSKMSVRI